MKTANIFVIAALLCLAVSCDDDDEPRGNAVSLALVSENYTSPVFLTEVPDNSGRLFVVDQPGQIYIIKDGVRLDEPFLDIQDKIVWNGPPDERGLLGLAFHPQYPGNGRFYVFYSGPLQEGGTPGWDHTNYVVEYEASQNPDVADASSARIVLAVDHPQGNHNGGTLAFGPDGYLYISIGDGGGGDDNAVGHVDDWYADNEGGNGQDITQNLLGNILRIGVTPPSGYNVPPDNPFVATDGLDEIYAYGLRNPYRFSFSSDGMLILADAGQELYEEINVIEKGGNYGWNVKEGNHCFSTANPATPPESCPDEDSFGNALIDPVIEFGNSSNLSDGLGNVSIGGYVYEGNLLPFLSGKYIFGVLTQDPDEMNGAIFVADRGGDTWSFEKLALENFPELNMFVLAFGRDEKGEMYVLTGGGTANSGKVYKLARQG